MGRRSRYSRSRSRRRRSERRKASRSRKRSRRSRRSRERRRSSDRRRRRERSRSRQRDRSRSWQRERSRTRSPHKRHKSSTRKRSTTPKSRHSRSPRRSPNSKRQWKSSIALEVPNDKKAKSPKRSRRQYSNSSSPISIPSTPPPTPTPTPTPYQSLDEKVQVHSKNVVIESSHNEESKLTENSKVDAENSCKVPGETIDAADVPSMSEKAELSMSELFRAEPSLKEVLDNDPSTQVYSIKFNPRRRKAISPRKSRGASQENESTSILYRNLVYQDMTRSTSLNSEAKVSLYKSIDDIPNGVSSSTLTKDLEPPVRLEREHFCHTVLPDTCSVMSPLKRNENEKSIENGLALEKQYAAEQESLEEEERASKSAMEENKTQIQTIDIEERVSLETSTLKDQKKGNNSYEPGEKDVCMEEAETRDNVAKASTPQPTLEKPPEKTIDSVDKDPTGAISSADTPKMEKDKKSLEPNEKEGDLSRQETSVKKTQTNRKRCLNSETTQINKNRSDKARTKQRNVVDQLQSSTNKRRDTKFMPITPRSNSRKPFRVNATRNKQKYKSTLPSSNSLKNKLAKESPKKGIIPKTVNSKLPPKNKPWCERARRDKVVRLKPNRVEGWPPLLEPPVKPLKKYVPIARRKVIKQSTKRIIPPLKIRVASRKRPKVDIRRNRIVTLDKSRSVFIETEDLSSIKITLKNRRPSVKVL